MQMDRENLVQRKVKPTALLQPIPIRPFPVRTVGRERVRDAIVETTCERVAEARREDLEGRDGGGEEAAPETEVEDGAPVG